jgi:hypothetical protein
MSTRPTLVRRALRFSWRVLRIMIALGATIRPAPPPPPLPSPPVAEARDTRGQGLERKK